MHYKTWFLFLIFLLSLTACEEQIEKGDQLSADELLYLRQRAALQCVSDTNNDYEYLEETSANNMLAFTRNQTYKYEYKKDSTSIESSYLYVWKVDPPNVYFRLMLTEAGVTSNKFIKISTSINNDMFRNIQQRKCDKTLSVSGTRSLIANIEEALTRVDTETLTEAETDYRIVTTYPAYFGALNKTRTKKTLNNKEVVTKTEVYDYTFATNAATTQPLLYTDVTITSKSYCVVKYSNATPPSTLNVYSFPFELVCTSSDTTGPDANGDAVIDFDPSVELVL